MGIRFFGRLRMTVKRPRMTVKRLRMTVKRLRMTGKGGWIPDQVRNDGRRGGMSGGQGTAVVVGGMGIRFFGRLRMTVKRLRMTVKRLRMTVKRLRMTGKGGWIPDQVRNDGLAAG